LNLLAEEKSTWQGRLIDREVYNVLLHRHFAVSKERRPIRIEITILDIRRSLPLNFNPCKITIKRALKRLEKSGDIKLHSLGYNRTGISIERFDTI